MRYARAVVLPFVVLVAMAGAVDDGDVAGTRMSCHEESSTGLYAKFFTEEG